MAEIVPKSNREEPHLNILAKLLDVCTISYLLFTKPEKLRGFFKFLIYFATNVFLSDDFIPLAKGVNSTYLAVDNRFVQLHTEV